MLPKRKSPRLKTHDYHQGGSYFVTICTYLGVPCLGKIVDANCSLSPLGKIAQSCWEAIPEHYPSVELGKFQIMPDHMHGIITLAGKICDDPQFSVRKFGGSLPGSLSAVIGSFKSAVTRRARELNLWPGTPLWKSRFHDHIIRGDEDYFWTEIYIEANPIIWFYGSKNPDGREISASRLEDILRKRLRMDGEGLAQVMGSKMFEGIRIRG